MATIKEVLAQFELQPSTDFHVFGGEVIAAASAIETNYRKSVYDHRPYIQHLEPDSLLAQAVKTEQYRIGYACFKREVARVLKPQSILEIGVGMGISGLAFLNGYPLASYLGIDNDSDPSFPIKPSQYVIGKMNEQGYKSLITIADTQKLDVLPISDLVHVDGDHRKAAVRNDVALAWKSGAKWILCDDARDSEVVAGTFEALYEDLNRGSIEWAYFPDTWTGNLLIRTDHRRGK
jgi:hypothetical protein